MDANAKHTPGPWGIRKTDTGPWAIFNVDGAWIAVTTRGQWRDEDKANARLIAAAPDLLAALENMLDVFLDTEGTHGSPEQDAVSAGNAAIAKATGVA